MARKYCTACGSHVMQNFVKCPQCGGQTWSAKAITRPTGYGSGASSGPTIGTPAPVMQRQGVLQAIPYTARKTFTVSGRASRSEYWWFFLFQAIAFVALPFVVALAADRYDNTALVILLGIILVCFYCWITVCGLTLTIRRLHDQDRSGWWLAIPLLTYVGIGFVSGFEPKLETSVNGASTIVTLGWLIFISQRGSRGGNQYGNEPEYFV
jgi:uncharacterized membrane protein YhaH (DUF805 family)